MDGDQRQGWQTENGQDEEVHGWSWLWMGGSKHQRLIRDVGASFIFAVKRQQRIRTIHESNPYDLIQSFDHIPEENLSKNDLPLQVRLPVDREAGRLEPVQLLSSLDFP
ncbi:hypothetical protein AYL99_11727 [Fonsecaea erecta]|uniref:Uncharacterized protein n=1 Tax=Fonsecaea erecta TaxID=1367422 RepID=A0A178Z341_9EURO|nr:hypothetical protein AYL99_11727 [Fonsecaea erecta]OAP54192.1 hypothetical protein AYL99_11727 [Fonsecaea erecta]